MRPIEDRRGGGLMLLHKEGRMTLEKENTKNCDIISAFCNYKKFDFRVIGVYISVDDQDRNKKIYSELRNILSNDPSNLPTVILGDFNGHIGFLGKQKINRNGHLLLNFVEDTSLIILNHNPLTEGTITWKQGGNESVIDFILVNDAMLQLFNNMIIDEERSIYDLSDHSLLLATFNVKTNQGRKQKSSKQTYEYLKINEETEENFLKELENYCGNEPTSNIELFESYIKDSAEKTMKVIKEIKKIENMCPEPPWLTNDIRTNIKQRKRLNRIARNCKEDDKEKAIKEYHKQKVKTQHLIRVAIEEHENNVTTEIREDKSRKKTLGTN